jgi:hypothetical protein
MINDDQRTGFIASGNPVTAGVIAQRFEPSGLSAYSAAGFSVSSSALTRMSSRRVAASGTG